MLVKGGFWECMLLLAIFQDLFSRCYSSAKKGNVLASYPAAEIHDDDRGTEGLPASRFRVTAHPGREASLQELRAGSPATPIVENRKPWANARMLVFSSLFLFCLSKNSSLIYYTLTAMSTPGSLPPCHTPTQDPLLLHLPSEQSRPPRAIIQTWHIKLQYVPFLYNLKSQVQEPVPPTMGSSSYLNHVIKINPRRSAQWTNLMYSSSLNLPSWVSLDYFQLPTETRHHTYHLKKVLKRHSHGFCKDQHAASIQAELNRRIFLSTESKSVQKWQPWVDPGSISNQG